MSFSPKSLSALAFLGALLVQGADAVCEAEIRRVEAPGVLLDPFDGRQRPAQITLVIANPGDEDCVASVVIRDLLQPQGARASRQGVELEFIERRRSAVSVPGALAMEDVRVPAGKEQEIQFTPKLSFSSVPLRGARQFELTADIYDGTLQSQTGSTPFDLNVEVLASTAISLAGMSADRTVYLGDLRPGARGNASFYVQSNGPYKMTIRSENRGVLTHTEDRRLAGIRYEVQADDQIASLTQAMTVYRNDRTPLLGERMILGIRTAPSPLSFAGTYKDVIEVEVTPY